MTAVATRPLTRLERVVENDIRDAWARYLADTESLEGDRYEHIEPRAWRRLELELRTISARRAAAR